MFLAEDQRVSGERSADNFFQFDFNQGEAQLV